MVHLIPFYLFACFIAGIAAFATAIAAARKRPGNGFPWLAAFAISMSLSIFGNAYKTYSAINLDPGVGIDDYAVTIAMLVATSVQFMSMPLFLHRYIRFAFMRFASAAVIALEVITTAIAVSPFSIEYDGERASLIFHPANFAVQLTNLAVLTWCVALLCIIVRRHPDLRVRKALRRLLILTVAFLPLFARDLLYFGATTRVERLEPVVPLYPLYLGLVSVVGTIYGLNWLFGSGADKTEQSPRTIPENTMNRFALTVKEREIIPLVLAGEGNKQIAKALGISTKTVNNHLYNIYRKIGINSRFELIPLMTGEKKD